MNKELNKNIYRGLLLISFLAINAAILYGISAVLSYLNTGADKSSILHLQAKTNEAYLPKITWESLQNRGRPMEKQTLQEIEKDYVSAWYVRSLAYKSNITFGIADYYTDSARVKLYRTIGLNKKTKTTVNSTTLEHHPTLDFYSLDGTLVVFTDRNVLSYEETLIDDEVVFSKKDTTSYKVIMLLEDGFWRIRHLVAIDDQKEPIKSNHKILVKEDIENIKGLNYYPKENPWNMYGVVFNDSVIAQDFKIIKNMGLNTARIFVPYQGFGKAKIHPEKIEKLRKTLDAAEENNIKIVVTLFDFYGDYDIIDWTLTHRHAETIVGTFKDHKAILAWDVKNEPDLDFESRGKEKVLAWLEQMVSTIKIWDTNHPVTIGWSSPEAAVNLGAEVDFVSFHYYKKVLDFKKSYLALKNAVPNKPLVLQEYGLSSYSGIWNAFTGSQKKQAKYYQKMQAVLHEEKTPYLFWTLYDFEKIPTSVVGKLPWRKKPQEYYGCIDKDGKEKASMKVLSVNKIEKGY